MCQSALRHSVYYYIGSDNKIKIKEIHLVSSEVFAAVWLTILFFWDMTLCLTRSLDPKILSQHISRIFSVQTSKKKIYHTCRKFILPRSLTPEDEGTTLI